MQCGAIEPCGIEIVGAQLRRRATVGRHRAVPVGLHERDDDARALAARPADLDAAHAELAAEHRAGIVVRLYRDDASLRGEGGRPGRDVRGLPARSERRHGRGVVPRRQARVEPDDHVEEQIAEGADNHRRIVSWTARTSEANVCAPSCTARVLGASAAVAAARRRRPRRSVRLTPAGLAAFEDAPCFQETLEKEAAERG